MGDQTIINIEELRKNKTDSLPYHLWSISLDCKMKRDSYWRYHHELRKKSDIISIPLLIFSTATGFFSVSQLNNNDQTIGIVLTIVSIISAIIAALQKFYRFSERSENAKDIAKNYARLGRKIENTMVLVESNAVKMPQEEFTKFINTVQNDSDMLLQETNDVPDELIADRNAYKAQLENLNRIKMTTQQQSSEISPTDNTNLTREMNSIGLNIDDMRMMNQMMSRGNTDNQNEMYRTDSVKMESIEMERIETEPVITEPVRTEPVRTEPVRTEPVRTEPVRTEPVRTEPIIANQMIEYLHSSIRNETDETKISILANLLEHVNYLKNKYSI